MRHIYRAVVLVCVLTLMGACGQANVVPTAIPLPTALPTETLAPTSTPQAVTNETLEQARPALVRIVNAAPDAPALNVFAGFSAIATNLAFTQYTEPTSFEAGDYKVKVQQSGSNSNDKALLESDVKFPSGESFTILITGIGQQLSLTIVPTKTEALQSDESIIQAINGLSDNSSMSLKTSSLDLAKDVAFGQTTLTPIIAADKTDLTFQFGDKTLAYSANLKSQTNITLIAAGTAAKPSIIQFESAAPKRIQARAINASPDITLIDVYIDDLLLNGEIAYGRPTERKALAAGQYTVRVYASGADRKAVEPLTGQVVSLIDGDSFDVVLLGSASKLSILVFAENNSPTQANMARVAFLNTVPTIAMANVQASSGTLPNIPNLYYGQAPTFMDAQAGVYSFIVAGINSENVGSTLELADNVQFEAGFSYLYLITGRLDGKPIILSDKVDSNASAIDPSAPNSQQAAKVRFINASSQTLDFSINGKLALGALAYGAGSDLVDVTVQTATITISEAGQAQVIGQEEATLQAGSSYSVVAYSGENKTLRLLVINDDNLIFDGSSPHLRLINVSISGDNALGLAFSTPDKNATPTVESPIPVTPEVTVDPNQPIVPFTLPFGVQKLVSDIGASSSSSVILMPVGDFDLHIIDSITNQMTLSIPKVSLKEGVHIDVVAFKDQDNGQVKAFAINYPKPS